MYGYNGRSELTAADRWTGTGPDDANKQDVAGDYGYAYDPIGNRLSYDPAGANTVYYCANSLNQYTTTDDAATCPPSTPAQSFAYDEDGNLVYEEGGSLATPRAYVYDAENRLIQVGPAGSPEVGDRRVTFTYDYRGRRVKQVGETWSGSGWISELRLFVWDDWKMVLERRLAQYGQPPPTRAYTWGLDLAGQRASGRGGRTSPRSLLEGAGTIGGLLAVADGTGGAGTLTYVYCYDANGNVGQVVDPAAANVTAALVATYEYDPYGGVAASAGSYAATNPVRFSTKYWDDATGLGYWGYRFYRADLGRWVNRDPIGERGGMNLLGYVLNGPSRFVDRLGLCIVCSPGWGAGPEYPSPPETDPDRSRVLLPGLPPPDRDAYKDTDCGGLALRDPSPLPEGEGSKFDDEELKQRNFEKVPCDQPCEPGGIKCWRWTYTEVVAIPLPGGKVMVVTSPESGHIVCGMQPAGGAIPLCWDKFGKAGPISEQPRPCNELRPGETTPYPNEDPHTVTRSNFKEECFCGSTDGFGPRETTTR